jgi:chemotaxis methyl-accepting protein methylase
MEYARRASRNLVLTYSLQIQVLRKLAARLRYGGYLVIGAHEALPSGMAIFNHCLAAD